MSARALSDPDAHFAAVADVIRLIHAAARLAEVVYLSAQSLGKGDEWE